MSVNCGNSASWKKPLIFCHYAPLFIKSFLLKTLELTKNSSCGTFGLKESLFRLRHPELSIKAYLPHPIFAFSTLWCILEVFTLANLTKISTQKWTPIPKTHNCIGCGTRWHIFLYFDIFVDYLEYEFEFLLTFETVLGMQDLNLLTFQVNIYFFVF